jgi:hypothetical protein
MKRIKLVSLFLVLLIANQLTAQSLKVELIKEDNHYVKTLTDGKVECNFYVVGVQSEPQAKNLEKYVQGFRGVEHFTLTFDNTTSKYLAQGLFYQNADIKYFKYLFSIMKVEQVFKDNSWIKLEQFNNLQ